MYTDFDREKKTSTIEVAGFERGKSDCSRTFFIATIDVRDFDRDSAHPTIEARRFDLAGSGFEIEAGGFDFEAGGFDRSDAVSTIDVPRLRS